MALALFTDRSEENRLRREIKQLKNEIKKLKNDKELQCQPDTVQYVGFINIGENGIIDNWHFDEALPKSAYPIYIREKDILRCTTVGSHE